MASDKITTYPGKKIDVTWDGRLCIHVGECGYSSGKLFVGGRDPWCQPDLVSVDNTVEVVKRCPTGALAYHNKEGEQESAASDNTVQVVYNGPLYLKGELDIADAEEDMPATRYRAALCRCGLSRNKPFCDNSHIDGGFHDAGAVGDVGDEIDSLTGKLQVTAVPDGPILLDGRFRIIAASGRVAWTGEKAALCRCGQSKNKPFCDGSHKAAGFKTS